MYISPFTTSKNLSHQRRGNHKIVVGYESCTPDTFNKIREFLRKFSNSQHSREVGAPEHEHYIGSPGGSDPSAERKNNGSGHQIRGLRGVGISSETVPNGRIECILRLRWWRETRLVTWTGKRHRNEDGLWSGNIEVKTISRRMDYPVRLNSDCLQFARHAYHQKHILNPQKTASLADRRV